MKKILLTLIAIVGVLIPLGNANLLAADYYAIRGNCFPESSDWIDKPMTNTTDGKWILENVAVKQGNFGIKISQSVGGNQTGWINSSADDTSISFGAALGCSTSGKGNWWIANTPLKNVNFEFDPSRNTLIITECPYPDQMYMIGNVGTITWNPTQGVKMSVAGNGVYTLENVYIGSSFAFTSQLSTNSGDWNGAYNANRYGPFDKDRPANIGSNDVDGRGDLSWSFKETGSYDVKLDLANKTMTLSAPTLPPTYPETLYVIGSLKGGSWKTNYGVQMNKTADGVFSVDNVEILDNDSQGANFSFCTQLASGDNDWTGIGTRYGATSTSDAKLNITNGQTYDLLRAGNPGAFSGVQGTYSITVDLTTMKMTATWVEKEDPYPSELYLIGYINSNSWVLAGGEKMNNEGNGKFTLNDITLGTVAGHSYFSFSTAVSDDWNNLGQRYGGTADNIEANYSTGDTGATNVLQKGNNAFYVPSGKYNFTVQFNEDGSITLTLKQVSQITPITLYIAGENINGEKNWNPGMEMTYSNGVYTWSGTSLGTQFKIFDGDWSSNEDYGVDIEKNPDGKLSLGEPFPVVRADGSGDIYFNDLSWVQNPTVVLDPVQSTVTVTGYRPLYLRGQMTVPTDWGVNPSYLCSAATNQDGQTVYTLTVASFPGNSQFKFGSGEEENWVVSYGMNNGSDMVANNSDSYPLTQGGDNMSMADSWINVTFNLTIDKDDASKAYLMITGTKDDASNWTLTFGNDKTNQSGSVINGVYTLTIVSTSKAGLIYIYPPAADDIQDVYYMVTPNAAETSSYAVGSYSKVNKIASGEYEGAYAISLPLGKGTLSLYYTDSNGDQHATQTYNYKVETGIPTAVDSIEAAEEGEAVYYNLQGVRVDNPERGIFVKVVNGKATKVVM